MATAQEEFLREAITSVQQRPRFDVTGQPTQVVRVGFKTPHEFTGVVTMSLAEWTDPKTRIKRVIKAIVDLEGPFWDGGQEGTE